MDVNAIQNSYHHEPNISKPCLVVNITVGHSIWHSDNPFSQAFPLLAYQIACVTFATQVLYYILRPFRIPQFVSSILCGVLLGPSGFFEKTYFFKQLFPLKSVILIETVAYYALTCHMFFVGLEMDISSVFHASKKAVHIAAAGALIPFIFGVGLFFLLNSGRITRDNAIGCFYWGVTLAVTGSPVVSQVLRDLKLLHSEIGTLASSTSVLSELVSWILVAILWPFHHNAVSAAISVVSTIGFTVFCVFLVRPVLANIIDCTSGQNNKFSENYLGYFIAAISIIAVVSEMIGMNMMIGAFIFGLMMPNRVLAKVLLDRCEEFMTRFLLPLFFASCGIRVKFWTITGTWIKASFAVILSCSAKILSTFFVGYFHKMAMKDSFALGLLMNAKGILALVVFTMGLDHTFLQSQEYAVMIISILLMTAVVPLVLRSIYPPSSHLSQCLKRSVQNAKPNAELRILACCHDYHDVSGIINLIDSSNATEKSPIFVVALHLVEVSGPASAHIVHTTKESGVPFSKRNRGYAKSEPIISALEIYQNLNDMVSFEHLTTVSPLEKIPYDICDIAEGKEIMLVILPFHEKYSREGKTIGECNPQFRGVNRNVLDSPPCSVGIFLDKGFGLSSGSVLTMRKIAMVFIGGPDDREALAYAWRMAGSQGIRLTVVRFLPGENVEEVELPDIPSDRDRLLSSVSYVTAQVTLDENYINEFRLRTAGDKFITYKEKVVSGDEDLTVALKDMHHPYDLYVVGRGEGFVSPLTAGLAQCRSYPELGPLGNLLAMSNITQGSVLVVQQYDYCLEEVNFADTPFASNGSSEHLGTQQPHCKVDDHDDDNKKDKYNRLELKTFAKHKDKGLIDV